MARISQEDIKPIDIQRMDVTTLQDLQAYLLELINQINNFVIPPLVRNAKRIEIAFKNISSLQTLAAADLIEHNADIVQVAGDGGAVILTSTPTISNGYDGERLAIIGTSNVNTVELQDNGALPGSSLELAGGANFILGAGDVITFIYSGSNNIWCEESRSQN